MNSLIIHFTAVDARVKYFTISVGKDTIRHAQPVGVNDLSYLEHTEQPTSVTEIVDQGISQDRFGSKSLSSVTRCKFFI